jgi:hypothetical protein
MNAITKEFIRLQKIDESKVEAEENDNYINVFVDGDEWLILNDEGRKISTISYIEDTVEYFNPTFLSRLTGISDKIFTAIQEPQVIDTNRVILLLIKGTCGMDKFVEESIHSDGYGHFLSPYDGEEIKFSVLDGWDTINYYAYRIN